MPSQKPVPWWFTPTEFQIYPTEKAVKRCGLPSLLISQICYTMAKKLYPIRPKRARKKWVESVCVNEVTYFLSCQVDDEAELIVVTNIRVPKK